MRGGVNAQKKPALVVASIPRRFSAAVVFCTNHPSPPPSAPLRGEGETTPAPQSYECRSQPGHRGSKSFPSSQRTRSGHDDARTRRGLFAQLQARAIIELVSGCPARPGDIQPRRRSNPFPALSRRAIARAESAPFSLLNYADALKHAKQMAEVTQKRYMPPWLSGAWLRRLPRRSDGSRLARSTPFKNGLPMALLKATRTTCRPCRDSLKAGNSASLISSPNAAALRARCRRPRPLS